MHETGSVAARVVRVDEDDATVPRYRGICERWGAELVIGPRIGCGASYNDLWRRYPDAPWYGCIQDDVIPETDGWEVALARASEAGIAYPDDGIQGERLVTNPVIAGELTKRLGFLAIPWCSHWYIDDAWRDIGHALRCLRYVPEVKLTHAHHLNGKAEKDATYKASEARAAQDRRAYIYWRHLELPRIAEKVTWH